MEPTLIITLRNIKKIPDMDAFIRERLAELLKVDSRISECRVFIERTKKFLKSGNPFLVRVIIRIPGSPDIVVKRNPSGIQMRDPLFTTISNVFTTAKRKIAEMSDKEQRGTVRFQAEYGASVFRIFHEKGYGFLKTDSGKSVFFHRSSVVGDEFDLMEEGTGVWFIEREGDKGPWASSVRICPPPSE